MRMHGRVSREHHRQLSFIRMSSGGGGGGV